MPCRHLKATAPQSVSDTSGRPRLCASFGRLLFYHDVTPAVTWLTATTGVSTNPTDVLKVRLQMQNELSKQATTAAVAVQPQQQLTLLQMARHMVRTEGLAALMNGWQASVMREMSYSAIRMGLYDEVKELLAGGSAAECLAAAWCTSAAVQKLIANIQLSSL